MGLALKQLTEAELQAVIETREPRGLFYYRSADGSCTGVDNTTGDAWTEEFPNFLKCFTWLVAGNI